MYSTLINADQLKADFDVASWVIFDTRAYLTDFAKGRALYEAGHIPNAHFLDMESVLSGEKSTQVGRHPLPDEQAFISTMAAFGVAPGVQVVVYDDMAGAMAARLWWMLRMAGHEAVAVLNGGLPSWQAEVGELSTEIPEPNAATAALAWDARQYLSTAQVLAQLDQLQLVDARSQERFAGDAEPIDPVAGHIPGAVNRPFQANLTEAGLFKTPEVLRREWLALIDATVPVTHMCGSGVTACHNLLAMHHAGLTNTNVYVGSWSEWIRDADRPIAFGAE
ncbi:sulfurtransferase [Neptunomonas sp. XY-337]|uniref:sulfurtransferase n=1 Tax=Neptunomonas sp. XY-337 TaxID=2561897 RepID=UPI0010AA7160|nr:sulfurtransferase [Neptunomonas sp. XY-337]